MTVRSALIAAAIGEWEYFGKSTRSLQDEWHIAGDEADPPFTKHISQYWSAVGRPSWDGNTKEAWSGAFICWCFKTALKKSSSSAQFRVSAKHSKYIDKIRRHQEMSPALVLTSVQTEPLAPGDLVWNARGNGDIPTSLVEAVERLNREPPDYFDSHVDIVVDVSPYSCETIGGNVSNQNLGGSVTRSSWALDANGFLVDTRKKWLGVVKNGL